MELTRRQILNYGAAAAAVAALPTILWAKGYPSRPVRLIVASAPGTGPDMLARLLGQWLSERLGQQFVIENRPGGGNNIGTEAVVKAAPDGYTLLLVGTANAVNATLFDRLSFNFMRDIAPVGGIMSQALVMVVDSKFPAKTLPEFIAYARSQPGKISMASAGYGSSPHMAGELFKIMAKLDVVHIPYRGGPAALTDMLGGRVHMMFVSLAASIDHINSGKLRPLGVSTATRLKVLPGVPPVADVLPGYEATGFFGIGAPKDTAPEIVELLNKEINAGLEDPKIRGRIDSLDGTALRGSPADFGRFIAMETEKWAGVIKSAGIRAK